MKRSTMQIFVGVIIALILFIWIFVTLDEQNKSDTSIPGRSNFVGVEIEDE